ncbi:substrate-binding domain-containing protein [Nonomuraea aridisoli]|uniref:substrate-binding domain-containing protein n=1 Tax=Nonomuraea aridisoli TaxID=2070368 RepID=UPI0034DD263D
MAAARSAGLRVPEQLRVVCASESGSYETTSPPVTTLSLDPLGITRLAMELLIEVVEGGVPPTPRGAIHPTRLFPRASSLPHRG